MTEPRVDGWKVLAFLLTATVFMVIVPTPYLRALLSVGVFALIVRHQGEDPRVGTLSRSIQAAALAFAMTLVLLPLSRIEVGRFDPSILLSALPFHLSVAIWEEVIYRGYPLLRFSRTNLLTSSLMFSLIHAFNPGFGLQAFLGIFVAGLALGAMRYEWGLGPVVSMHFSWNVFMEHIWGYPTSGLRGPSLFVSELMGPDLITGGTFGPEASLIVMTEFLSLFLIIRLVGRSDRLP